MIGFGIAQSRNRSVFQSKIAERVQKDFTLRASAFLCASALKSGLCTIPAFRLIPSGSLFIETVKRFSETLCCDEHPAEARGCGSNLNQRIPSCAWYEFAVALVSLPLISCSLITFVK
jgi:hypothetical protein